MAVVVSGTAPYVSPSNAFQLSASAVSIGRVLISRPAAAAQASSGTSSGIEAKLQRMEESQQARTRNMPALSSIIDRIFDGGGKLDIYL